MTAVRSEWSPSAKRRRALYRDRGVSPTFAARLVREEWKVRARIAAQVGHDLAAKAEMIFVEGDDRPFKIAIHDGDLNDDQRAALAGLGSKVIPFGTASFQ